jgi:hypothetical protein
VWEFVSGVLPLRSCSHFLVGDKYIDSAFHFTEGEHVEFQPDNLYTESQLNAIRKKEKASIREMLVTSKELVALCDEIKLSKVWDGNSLFLFYYICMSVVLCVCSFVY